MILVTGATGTVGREVVGLLVAGGHKTRVLVRDPAKARFDKKVEVAVGDLDKPDTLARAAEGAERVFALASGPQLAAQQGSLAQAAKRAGAKHIVKLSVLGVDSGLKNAIVEWHTDAEKRLRESGLAWTFVQPGSFMSNSFAWIDMVKTQGKVYAPYGDGKFPPIHPRDIAAVCVKALTTPGHEGKAYPLTGPEALGMAEQVRILSEAIGKPLQYVPVPDEAARDGMLKTGMPPVLVEALLQMAGWVRAGKMAQVRPTVEEVTGRKPLSYRDWARENAAAFK